MILTRGQRLRRVREQAGVSLREAARGIGVSAPYLSLLESEHKGKNLDHIRTTLEKAAAYFKVNPAYLLAETPQEYIRAYLADLGESVAPVFGERLRTVLRELERRWGDPFSLSQLADTLGTTVEVLQGYMDDEVPITDSAADQLSQVTGAPLDWLVPRAVTDPGKGPEIQRLLTYAVEIGIEPEELEALLKIWASGKNRKPSA